MSDEKLLTVREVSLLLHVSEKEVMDLAETGVIPAYKVGGVYIRFKKEQVEEYWRSPRPHSHKKEFIKNVSFRDKLSDFLYFYDFYIFAGVLIILLLTVIVRG